MRQTTNSTAKDFKHDWFIINAENVPLGRLSTKAASILCGKHKPTYCPNYDCGDYVIVINADKVYLSGNKLDTKKYYSHSQYPGGLKVKTAKEMKEFYPVEMVEKAIQGMIPHTKLGNKIRKNLFVYVGDKHPHEAQKPVEIKITA